MSTSVFPGERPDRLEEECGVFGIYAPGLDVARMTCFGLQALQHRGQESAGIAVGDGATILASKDLGLQNFTVCKVRKVLSKDKIFRCQTTFEYQNVQN